MKTWLMQYKALPKKRQARVYFSAHLQHPLCGSAACMCWTAVSIIHHQHILRASQVFHCRWNLGLSLSTAFFFSGSLPLWLYGARGVNLICSRWNWSPLMSAERTNIVSKFECWEWRSAFSWKLRSFAVLISFSRDIGRSSIKWYHRSDKGMFCHGITLSKYLNKLGRKFSLWTAPR